MERAPDARWREIMRVAVTHLHAFVRKARLTEAEFQQVCAVVAQLGQRTTASHNEVVLAAGSLGISALVCLLNNARGDEGTTANLLGPFWRADAPRRANGDSIAAPGTAGDRLVVNARVQDRDGAPVAGAEVHVWQSSAEGFYENQDPGQPDMNLRGIFTTDEDGRIAFRSVKPAGYPIPVGGPVGTLLRMQGRHNLRPAHVHFMIHKPGYRTQFSQVYAGDDPNIDTDVQFGVTRRLVADFVRHEPGPWYSLDYTFTIEPGEARLPRAPIGGKAEGERPVPEVLSRRP
nr:dioxygenase [Ramlibacter albus]